MTIDEYHQFCGLKWLTMADFGVIGADLQLAPHPGEAVAALKLDFSGACPGHFESKLEI